MLPLGALAAGFGLLSVAAVAQTPPVASTPAEAVMAPISVKARTETDATSVRATTSGIGKGNQELRDIPQSVTVVTEKLIADRRIDTLKEALHQTAGITFQAAEGGEEDIRLRGFSLAASGDIYVDGIRDPAFYARDTFSFDRIELLRGSASMLFGRGSTGGVVNQVSKLPFLNDAHQVEATVGNGRYARLTGDFNIKTGESSALRLNVMKTDADHWGNGIDKQGIAPTFRWGIGSDDEFTAGLYYLRNDNGINYGIPWLRENASNTSPAGLIDIDPRNYYNAKSDYSAGGVTYGNFGHTHRFQDGGKLTTTLRHGKYERDQRAGAIRFCVNRNGNDPDCPTVAPNRATINDATILRIGTNNKVQDMTTTYLQSDYSNRFNWFGVKNDVLTGIDVAHEVFHNYNLVVPAGVTLDKNTPRVTIGSPNPSNWVDESLRRKTLGREFEAQALGV
ncbi:MAG TPA: TonB-dependent receptor plug domain-containing protein, partial [Burkholderiaceae bacterium]|nr:TonB-dependent receptor plug domain-containing protein [Burkholderiaceae bacterium]